MTICLINRLAKTTKNGFEIVDLDIQTRIHSINFRFSRIRRICDATIRISLRMNGDWLWAGCFPLMGTCNGEGQALSCLVLAILSKWLTISDLSIQCANALQEFFHFIFWIVNSQITSISIRFRWGTLYGIVYSVYSIDSVFDSLTRRHKQQWRQTVCEMQAGKQVSFLNTVLRKSVVNASSLFHVKVAKKSIFIRMLLLLLLFSRWKDDQKAKPRKIKYSANIFVIWFCSTLIIMKTEPIIIQVEDYWHCHKALAECETFLYKKIVIRYIRPSRRKRCEFHLIECLSLERLRRRFTNIRKWVWNGISWRSPSCPKHSDSTFHEIDFRIQGHVDSKQLTRSNNTPFQLTVSTWMIHLLGVRCTNRKQDYFPTKILTTKTTNSITKAIPTISNGYSLRNIPLHEHSDIKSWTRPD